MRRPTLRPEGSIYVLVLGMSMLVGAVGLGAVLLGRAQARSAKADADFTLARFCAHSGIELAMFRIQQDPNWRTDLGNGTWFSNLSLAQGTVSVSAVDPITGDITVASNHPVVLTSTGRSGSAVYKLQQTVQVNASGIGCLALASCSGSDTNLNNCSLTANQVVSANGNINNGGSSVLNANVQAVGSFSGGATYGGAKTQLTQAIALPDPTHVFDTYNAAGTSIPLASLLQSNSTQLVSNPSFETNATGWYIYSGSLTCSLSTSTAQHQDGNYSLMTSGRLLANDVPATDLPLNLIRNGDTYAVTVPVYAVGIGNVQATLVLQATGGTQSFSTTAVALKTLGGWVNAQGNLAISWTGVLTKATLTLTTNNLLSTLYIDKVSLTDSSLPSSAYVMDRCVLSPTSNPFGSPNTNGIYVINCNNKAVTIGPCRIVGTLVLTNVGGGTTIQGPITWEPAVAGYPALLADNALTISIPSAVALSEATYGINFNPTGTPYPYPGGAANTNASDSFPSIINGLIYCGGDLTLPTSTAPTFNGTLVTSGKLVFNCTSATLTYNNASYVTPPPGFSTSNLAVYPVLGTTARTQ